MRHFRLQPENGEAGIARLARKNPGVIEAHLKLVDFYSQTFLLGPAAEKELLDLVAHLFTPEEAEIAQHLPFIYGRAAKSISRKIHRPVDKVEASLARMADENRTVIYVRKEEIQMAAAIDAHLVFSFSLLRIILLFRRVPRNLGYPAIHGLQGTK